MTSTILIIAMSALSKGQNSGRQNQGKEMRSEISKQEFH